MSYRDVMAAVLAELAAEEGVSLAPDERDALGRSLPTWPVFDDVAAALTEVHDRGWRLVALTNSDRDLIEASIAAIGVPFDGAIVASEIGSYKPAHGHWRAFASVRRRRAPARPRGPEPLPRHRARRRAGIPSIWINRLGERGDPPPTRELPDLRGLADVLDELVGTNATLELIKPAQTLRVRVAVGARD